jgi:hypothetical protein
LLLRSRTEELLIKLHPGCARHGNAVDAPCRAVVQALREHPRQWFLSPARQLITSVRRFLLALYNAGGLEGAVGGEEKTRRKSWTTL